MIRCLSVSKPSSTVQSASVLKINERGLIQTGATLHSSERGGAKCSEGTLISPLQRPELTEGAKAYELARRKAPTSRLPSRRHDDEAFGSKATLHDLLLRSTHGNYNIITL